MNPCAKKAKDAAGASNAEADKPAKPAAGKQPPSASEKAAATGQQPSPDTLAAGKQESWLVW